MIFNILVLIIVFLIIFHLYSKSKLIFVCLLPFIIQYLWMFVSLLVIEQGVYINEQGRYGEFHFSNFYLLLFFVVTIISFVVFFQLFNKGITISFPKIKFFLKDEMAVVLFIAILITLLSQFNLWNSPSVYTSENVSKFNYWNNSAFPFLKVVLGNTIGFLPFVFGLIFKKYKRATILLIILYSVYLVGIDQKFTAFLFGIIGFFVSFTLINYKNLGSTLNIISFKKRYLIFFGGLLFVLVLMKYTKKNPYEYLNLSPIEAVFYRAFGLQGHLFWGVTERYIVHNESNTWDLKEFPYGMRVLMEEFMPDEDKKHLESLKERGVSWTNGYPAILIRIFPLPLALICHFFIFSIVPLIYIFILKSIRNGNFIISIIFFQLSLWLLNVYTMAYFHQFVKICVIIFSLSGVSYFFYQNKLENE